MRKVICLFVLFGAVSISPCHAQSRFDELLLTGSKTTDVNNEFPTTLANTNYEQQEAPGIICFFDWHYIQDLSPESPDPCSRLPQHVQPKSPRTTRRSPARAVYVQVSAQRSETEA